MKLTTVGRLLVLLAAAGLSSVLTRTRDVAAPASATIAPAHSVYILPANSVYNLAFPCNKPFAEAGPGTNSEIKDVASNFERFAKIDVNGEGRHPVFRALLAKLHPLCCRIKGEHSCCKVKGNFNEFLVDGRGVLVKHYPKRTPPAGAEQDIIALLADSESTTALTP
jgi:hypothetical protein